jgi:hypothetical protein
MSKNRSLVAVSFLVVAGCSSASSPDTSAPRAEEITDAPALGVTSSVSSPSTTASHQEWRRAMAKSVPPKDGCFTVSHPSTTWIEVPCMKVPSQPGLPARGGGVHPDIVGSTSGDFFAQVQGGAITSAEGAFPVVSGVTSANESLSLQLNSQPANTGYCQPNLQDPGPSYCQDQWQQFFYSGGYVFMQYWLIGVNGACPSVDWNPINNDGQLDCWINSPGKAVPAFSLADLGEVTFTAVAGSTDSVTLAVGTTLYAASQTSFFGLWNWWNQAEFNVFGPGGGETVVFDPGSTVLVRELVDGPQASSVPTCGSGSFTGEMNSLSLVPSSCCALEGPAGIQFTESNAAGSAAFSCPSANYCEPQECLFGAHWEGAPYCECVGVTLRHFE